MASQSKSRWGNFLQQAVAGVESRLDTILADDASSATATNTDGNPAEQASRKEIMAMSAGQKTGAGKSCPSNCSRGLIIDRSLS